MIIDCHTHIVKENENILFQELKDSKVDAINVIGIKGLYDNAEIIKQVKENILVNKKFFLTCGISIEDFENKDSLLSNLKSFDMIKIHPRLQGLKVNDVYRILNKLYEINIIKPIIIDMFPYRTGEFFISSSRPTDFEKILNDFSKYSFVFAHFGGIYLREVFMMMKCYKNLYADTSLTSRYFMDSPIEKELYYFIKRLEGDRVLYGSDYPEMHLDQSLNLQIKNMEKAGLSSSKIDNVLGGNFLKLISM